MFYQLTLPGGFEIEEKGILDKFVFKGKNAAVSDVVSRALLFIFPIAGLILLMMLIFGGFSMLTSGGNPEKMQKGQGMIVNAVVGFIIIFVAYWILQILQDVLGIGIY